MVWPFRRRKTGRHRLHSPLAGMVLPGVALAADTVTDPHAGAPEGVVADPAEAAPVLATPPAVSVPSPRVGQEPEIMPLPARVVLFFEDGSQQVMTPLSEESERMRAAAERLLGLHDDRTRAAQAAASRRR